MATPNYGFEKRQRELAKKRKKEEKLRAKADRKADPGDDGDSVHEIDPDAVGDEGAAAGEDGGGDGA